MAKTVLFLCTGNYYRSRFAEEIFNHLAERFGMDWRATSRALAIERGVCNVGPISKHTLRALERRELKCAGADRPPMGCEENDLSRADLVIALKEAEHLPLMRAKFPEFAGATTYWNVHDLDLATPGQAMDEIEQLVTALMEEIRGAS